MGTLALVLVAAHGDAAEPGGQPSPAAAAIPDPAPAQWPVEGGVDRARGVLATLVAAGALQPQGASPGAACHGDLRAAVVALAPRGAATPGVRVRHGAAGGSGWVAVEALAKRSAGLGPLVFLAWSPHACAARQPGLGPAQLRVGGGAVLAPSLHGPVALAGIGLTVLREAAATPGASARDLAVVVTCGGAAAAAAAVAEVLGERGTDAAVLVPGGWARRGPDRRLVVAVDGLRPHEVSVSAEALGSGPGVLAALEGIKHPASPGPAEAPYVMAVAGLEAGWRASALRRAARRAPEGLSAAEATIVLGHGLLGPVARTRCEPSGGPPQRVGGGGPELRCWLPSGDAPADLLQRLAKGLGAAVESLRAAASERAALPLPLAPLVGPAAAEGGEAIRGAPRYVARPCLSPAACPALALRELGLRAFGVPPFPCELRPEPGSNDERAPAGCLTSALELARHMAAP